MTPTLPDDADAWARAWRERLNDSAAFADAAADFEATVLFVIQPDDQYDGEPAHLLVEVDAGDCVAAASVAEADYDYALRGPYGAWKAMLQGDLDVTDAVMDGPFDVEGSTLELMQYRSAFSEMVRAAQAIDVEFAY